MRLIESSRLIIGVTLALMMLASSPVTSDPMPIPGPVRAVQPVTLDLPTRNTALFDGDDEDFFQYVDRYRGGRHQTPWQGGAYGFVRNPRRINGRTVYTRMHEGIDVKPIYRTPNGEPLDSVRTISDGRVVYTNRNARQSNYGKYVVIRHTWDGSPFYSLYAHLSEVFVHSGSVVRTGDKLGRIGYTGAGIDRRRAHLHLEVAMLINQEFQPWYDAHFQQEPNYHSVFSGLNLKGMDVTRLFLEHRKNPNLTVKEFVLEQEVAYTVTVPNSGRLDLLDRYPWLWDGAENADVDSLPALSIGFTRAGLPVRVTASQQHVHRPQVAAVADPTVAEWCATNGVLHRRRSECRVSRRGERYLELITL